MHHVKIILAAAALVALAAPATALHHPVPLPGEATAAVTLRLDAASFPSATLAGTKSCAVTVPSGATLATALDKAVLDGCFAGWTWTVYASSVTGNQGRFFTGADGRVANCDLWATWLAGEDPPLCTFYLLYENGSGLAQGVDNTVVRGGATYEFEHNVIVAAPLP